MSDWKTYKLGEVFTFSSGLSKAREYFGSGYDFVAFKDIFANIFLPEKLSSLVQSNEIERKSCSVLRGDVFLTRTSETYNELGISSVALNDYPNATFNGFTKRLRPNGNIIIVPEYAGYYFRSPKFRSLVTQYSSITTRASLNNEILSNLTIDIPIVALQTEIGKILKSLDDKIELNLQMNQTLEAMAQAIFKEWFVNFNFPKSLNRDSYDLYDDNDAENHNNQTNQKNHSADKLVDGLPKGWRMGKLNEVAVNFDSKRIPLSSRERIEKKGIYPYYGAASILDYVDEFIFNGTYLLMGEDGTVVTSEGFPVLQYVWGKFWVNNHTHVLQGKVPFSTEYLFLLLSKTQITHIITGAVQPKINQGNMNKIECVIPPKEILEDFQNIIQPLFEKRKTMEDENITLTSLRDSLLPKLMTGKIEIKE